MKFDYEMSSFLFWTPSQISLIAMVISSREVYAIQTFINNLILITNILNEKKLLSVQSILKLIE